MDNINTIEKKVVIDPSVFRGILNRNVIWPLVAGLLSAAFFVAIIFYLLSVSRWVESTDATIRRANEALKLCLDRETALRGYVITGNREFLEPYERAKIALGPRLGELAQLTSAEPPQRQRIDNLRLLSEHWLEYAQTIIALRSANLDAGDTVRGGIGKKIMDDIRGEFTEFIAGEEQIKSTRNDSAKNIVYALVGLFVFFSASFAVLLAYFGRRDLMYLSNTYVDVLNRQADHAKTLQHQAWLRDAQSQLADRVIGQQSLLQICGNVLQFLSRHLDAAVGAMYVLEKDAVLKRAASYAFSDEGEQRGQSLRLGEGLVGQAALDGRLLQLQEVPADYLRVNSGLGDTAPASVLILPVSSDQEVNAVVELGFARAVGAREIELLRQLAENIGTAVAAANYRQRLQVALFETQQLNEELQAQQEELRAANEELEAQARELEESQQRLESQHSELERSNQQLEQQAAALELQRDVVERKNSELGRAQSLLEQRANELERASRYKSEFLANMSHELRTPLNSSLILAKLLADNGSGNLNDDQIRFANSIYEAGNELLALINDILDISKVEAGKLEVHADHVALGRIVDALDSAFRPLALEKKIQFDIALAPNLPRTLFADRKRVEQILKNLLSNAIKFTEPGGRVELSLQLHSPSDLAFVVRDTGIGVAPEHQQDIFEAFRQGDGATNRKYGGTGLGLSISRELAQLLGGSIELHSEVGRGSEFTLLLPLSYREINSRPSLAADGATDARAAAPAAANALAAARKVSAPPFPDDRNNLASNSRTILIVEDEAQFAEILYDLAHQQRFNCLVANTADDGFEAALRFLPDAILLDMKLPDYSGLTVLERLKSNSKTRHIPVHIISVEDRSEAALLLGAVGYLIKPATRDALKTALDKLAQKLDQKVKRVLLVEDDATQRESIAQLIGDKDIEIVGVERGELALQQLKQQIFDCMIIDLRLPDMSGAELLRGMTAEEICSFPPVIVYTASSLDAGAEAELLRYSRSIIVKGARSPERLLDEVMLFLHKVEADLPAERQQMLREVRHRERAFEDRTVLVVDDDVRNIFALTSALEQKGARVEIARNGREALQKLAERQVGENNAIDLVLMDIMMPEMDGYEAIQRIRAQPQLARLPIIAVTAKAMRDDQERCLRAGANDYLAKPIDLDRLLSLMRVWMPQLRRL